MFPDVKEDPRVKYLILIYSNPKSRDVWQGFSPEQRAEGLRFYAALTDDLAASGELIVSEALADPSLAKRVHTGEGPTIVSDGPYAEVKEYLAGFFLVECDDMERALAVAARVPEAVLGLVEVRPVMAPGGWDI
jgi:hypothetical protein